MYLSDNAYPVIIACAECMRRPDDAASRAAKGGDGEKDQGSDAEAGGDWAIEFYRRNFKWRSVAVNGLALVARRDRRTERPASRVQQ